MRDVAFVQDPGKPGKSHPSNSSDRIGKRRCNHRLELQVQAASEQGHRTHKKASPQQVLRFNSEGYSESSLRNINWLVKKLSTHDALRLLEIQQELISLLITHGQGNIFA